MGKITVPEMGESVTEATVARWLKKEGDRVSVGEPVVSLETDKVDLEVGAEEEGVLARIEAEEGADVKVGAVLAVVEPAAAARADEGEPEEEEQPPPTSPLAREVARDRGVDLSRVQPAEPGRVTRWDVERHAESRVVAGDGRPEERVRMSRRRRTIARRLVEAQQAAAMLTTFNEVDMTRVLELRERRKAEFAERYGVKLGFTSFFVRAAVGALREFPQLNAEIDGDEVVLKRYYDIGIAVAADEGLVVPVLRDADRLPFHEIERRIADLAARARGGDLKLDELRGGTFSITNGGVFGSLLSTPILNPPQSGILGLHKVEPRPVAVEGRVEIRPMTYVALTYDHRLVDGREAVLFLVRLKELLEEPDLLLLGT